MTDTFRALFQEMIDWIDEETRTTYSTHPLVDRARATLAAGPVGGEQCNNDHLSPVHQAVYAFAAYLTTRDESFAVGAKEVVYPVTEHLRDFLASYPEATPVPVPVEGESRKRALDLLTRFESELGYADLRPEHIDLLRSVISPALVPVGERLPGLEDLDANGPLAPAHVLPLPEAQS